MSSRKIYKITNIINGKIYVGKTIKSLEVRFKEHITTARRWYNEDLNSIKHPYNSRLYPAMNLYGYDNFIIELLEELDEDSLDTIESREQYWISVLDTTNDKVGYNISPGGLGGPLFAGHSHTEESKKLMSEKTKGISQDRDFVKKRSYARANLLQDLETGELVSILDLPTGYFYPQDIIDYRIYKSNNKFYACLESPHNRKIELSLESRTNLIIELQNLQSIRASNSISACLAAFKARTPEDIMLAAKKAGQKRRLQCEQQLEQFLLDNNIDKNEYIQNYNKYKTNCPNRHLELIYKIPYGKIRIINKYLGLFGGGSGHKNGKVSLKEDN